MMKKIINIKLILFFIVYMVNNNNSEYEHEKKANRFIVTIVDRYCDRTIPKNLKKMEKNGYFEMKINKPMITPLTKNPIMYVHGSNGIKILTKIKEERVKYYVRAISPKIVDKCNSIFPKYQFIENGNFIDIKRNDV